MNSQRELRECPFCGGSARILNRQIGIKGRSCFDWWHSIQCAKCNAAVGYDDNRYRDKNDAVKAWNNRPETHKDCQIYLLGVLQDIRHKTGVYEKPMLSELADILANKISQEKAHSKLLAEALEECANDLGEEIGERYSGTLEYPSMMRKFVRDMEPVTKAKVLLKLHNERKSEGDV